MLRDHKVLFYPLVLTVFPLVFLYAENADANISLAEFIVPFAAIVLFTAILLLLTRLIVRNSVKAALIVSMILAVIFTYGPIFELMTQSLFSIAADSILRHRYLILAEIILLTVGIGAVLKSSRNLAPIMQAIAIGALILVIFNGSRIVASSVYGSNQNQGDGSRFQAANSLPSAAETLPDIYYLIFDSYSSAEVLDTIHGFDNSQFIGSLEEMGFFVVPEARSNYTSTFFSLPSALRMQYLPPTRSPLYRFQDNEVLNFVQNQGYTYVHLDSGHKFTKRNPYSDIEFLDDNSLKFLLSDFAVILMNSTILSPIAETLGIVWWSPFAFDQRKRFNENLEYLSQIPSMPAPTFTFSHNMPPHPPFIFDRNGNLPPEIDFTIQDPANTGWPSGPYTDEIFYLNTRIEELATQILERSATEPVIIIQGDHGSSSLGKYQDDETKGELATFERIGILNAYYLPEYCRSALYPTVTPVNTFRLVFDACLGANFGLLEDKSYWSYTDSVIESP